MMLNSTSKLDGTTIMTRSIPNQRIIIDIELDEDVNRSDISEAVKILLETAQALETLAPVTRH